MPGYRWPSAAPSVRTGTWRLGYYGSQHDQAGNATLDLQGLAVTAKRVFYRDGRVNPFFSLGLGNSRQPFSIPARTTRTSRAVRRGPADRPGWRSRRRHRHAIARRSRCAAWLLADARACGTRSTTLRGSASSTHWGGTAVRKVGRLGRRRRQRTNSTSAPALRPALRWTPTAVRSDDDGDGVTNENDKCPGTSGGREGRCGRLRARQRR